MISAAVLERDFDAVADAGNGDLGRSLEAITNRDVATAGFRTSFPCRIGPLTDAQRALLQPLIADSAPGVGEAGRSIPEGLKKSRRLETNPDHF